MLRYVLGMFAGSFSMLLVFLTLLNPENLWVNCAIILLVNIACGIFAYKYHKRKQQGYYERFKVKH